MKILYFLTLAALLLIFNCTPEAGSVIPACQTDHTGNVTFQNNTSDKYDIYINDVKQTTLDAGRSFTRTYGIYSITAKAVQVTGIANGGTPNMYGYDIDITLCGTKEIIFP
jgi:hypothetical protein